MYKLWEKVLKVLHMKRLADDLLSMMRNSSFLSSIDPHTTTHLSCIHISCFWSEVESYRKEQNVTYETQDVFNYNASYTIVNPALKEVNWTSGNYGHFEKRV